MRSTRVTERSGCVELGAAQSAAPHRIARALRARGFAAVSLLESALDVDGLGRFSFVAAAPRLTLTTAQGAHGRDPLERLRELLEAEAPSEDSRELAARAGVPFAGGAVLVLAYD